MANQLEVMPIPAEILSCITPDNAQHYRILPKNNEDGLITLYVDDAVVHPSFKDELEVILGISVELEMLPAAQIDELLSRYYLKKQTAKVVNKKTDVTAEDFLYKLIKEAKDLGSSDIHIETYEEKCRVRLRVDGLMLERYILKKTEYPALINKIKIMANLDISEKRLPQDGRIFFTEGGYKFDIRASVIPALFGEKVVLRILSNDATNIDIYKLGFSTDDLANYLEGIKRPNGMLLISGPTGSGKTTTLYATLKLLNKESLNILTIEDPIEYTLEGINQVQLKENIGLDFAKALRTFLRQDPDIIMVGEMRDAETANMGIRAALTGHLVLSTIHTNSAWGTIARLVDMGIPPFLVANTLNTTVAQRLLRLLCPVCKEEHAFDDTLYPRNFKPFKIIEKHYRAKGCDQCYFTGYRGRKAVYEVIPIDAKLAEKIKNSEFEVSNLLRERGIKTLTQNAFQLFESGDTSFEEIYPLLFNV